MADAKESSAPPTVAHETSAGSGWLFFKTIVGVCLGFVVFVLALSPKLYIASLRDTPEAWFERAMEHVKNDEHDEAIADFEKVLEFQPQRQRVFVVAEQKIQEIQQLKQLRREDAAEGAPEGEPEGETTEEGGEEGEGVPETDETTEGTESPPPPVREEPEGDEWTID